MSTFVGIDLESIKDADLTNEEVIELVIMYCNLEDIGPYREHLQALRDKYNMFLEVLPLVLEMFKYRDRMDNDAYRNLFVGLEDIGFESMFYDIVTYYQQDVNAGVYIRIVIDTFGQKPDDELCQDILRHINESKNDPDDPEEEQGITGPGVEAIKRYLIARIAQVSEYAGTPGYIRFYDSAAGDLPQVRLLDIDYDMDPREIAEALINQVDNYGLVISAAHDNDAGIDPKEAAIIRLTQDLKKLSLEKLEKYVTPFRIDPKQIRQVQDDELLFRTFGPVNPHPDDDFSVLTIFDPDADDYDSVGVNVPDLEKIYGGPRMFISMEYERDHDRDLPLDDWFVGHCQQCLRRIRKRHYARRRALTRGGWVGCYCTGICIRTVILFEVGSDDADDIKIAELELALNDEFTNLLNRIGIAERIGGDYTPGPLDEYEDAPMGGQDEVDDLLRKLPNFGKQDIPVDLVRDVMDMFGDDVPEDVRTDN